MVSKKLSKSFFEKYNINALHRPSKLAIAEVAGMSAGRVILYCYVATEKNHTVQSSRLVGIWTVLYLYTDSQSGLLGGD